MEHLQQQRGDAARHHRGEIAMHCPGRRTGTEQSVIPRRPRQIEPVAADHVAYLVGDLAADGAHEAVTPGVLNMLRSNPSAKERFGGTIWAMRSGRRCLTCWKMLLKCSHRAARAGRYDQHIR